MSFLCVLRQREDGDFDSCAAFQCDNPEMDIPCVEWTLQTLEHLRHAHEGDTFVVYHLANVDDVVSQDEYSASVNIEQELQDVFNAGGAGWIPKDDRG